MFSYQKNSQICPKSCVSCNCNKPTPSGFKIVIILDESMSMMDIKENMLKSLNILIREQQQIKERPATMTLIKFNSKVNMKFENMPIEEIRPLTSDDYRPDGSTALYDAIGYAINRFTNEHDVMTVIIIDGQDNMSRTYNKDYIAQKLNEKKKYNNWSTIYLSCDISTFEQGQRMGMANSSQSTNVQMPANIYGKYISNNLNSAISNFRRNGISVQSQLNHV